jgi:glycosyltransferase involved in cell wall biosynthesis
MPLVSVVVPAYNAAAYLEETLKSILAQESCNLEIIVVDDCSTDATGVLVKERFADQPVTYVRLEENHGGPSRARNVGVKTAKGEYIALCDADDLYLPGRLHLSIQLLENHPQLGMAFTNEVKFDDVTGRELGAFLEGYDLFNTLPKTRVDENCHIIKAEDAYACLLQQNYVMPSGVTLPRSVFDEIGFFDEAITNGDDHDLWFRVTWRYDIGFLNIHGFRYRIRESGISARGAKLGLNRVKVFRRQLDNDLPPALKKAVHRQLGVHHLGIGYYYQRNGDMVDARAQYLKSLETHLSFKAFKGIAITFLGQNLYLQMKKLKSTFTRTENRS